MTTSSDLKRRRIFTAAAVIAIAGVLSFLAFGNGELETNLVYYWSPGELREAGNDAIGASVRLGGLVAPGSVIREQDGLTLRFAVTDGSETVEVHSRNVPPAMFREGIGVVVEGTLRQDGTFESSRLMVKHDNEYQAPGTEDNRSMQELAKSLQFGTGG